jgi:cytochrome P450
MSFMPFLAGKRVCAGKTFAENSIKAVLPLLIKAFSGFEFVDKELYNFKPANNIGLEKRPEILIRLNF